VARAEFLEHVQASVRQPSLVWQPGLLDQQGGLHPLPPDL
jgi:hypothetical protein